MLRVVSTVTKENEANIMAVEAENPLDKELKPQEVVVRIDAAPINPSDLGVMMPAGTDEAGLRAMKPMKNGVSYPIDKKFAGVLAPRVERLTPCGNEGAGVVVKTGSSAAAKSFLNKVVSVTGGKTFAQYSKVHISQLISHNEGTTAEQAASSFVNPLTVVGFVETMKKEGHKAMIHTAAASQLGQMLVRLCNQENIVLINVVRKESQEKTLLDLGAKHVVRSDKASYLEDLAAVVGETQATLAFDAIGGGKSASNLLTAMEMGAKKFAKSDPSSPYGTDVFKQVYIYGGLDRNPTVLSRGFGFSWGLNAWLMPRFLATLPVEKIVEMKKTVADNITTVFQTEYYKRVTLEEMVQPQHFAEYMKQETGKKFLVVPNKNSNL